MEGLYHNTNLYSSPSYMMQHPDQHSYYSPPSTLPYRPNPLATHSAFSDVKPYNGCVPSSSPSSNSSSPHSDSLSLVSSNQPHRNNSITSLPTTSSMVNWSSPAHGFSWPNPYPPSNHYSMVRPSPPYSSSASCYSLSPHAPIQRPKLTTTVWEDEGTVCYQVDAKSVCVARRQDNDMINGTKLLNVVGMSRGKRDGILKNEKGRVVVKVGAMHLKGVWITFERAKDLASKFKITDILYPLFTDDPSVYLCPSTIPGSTAANIPCQGNVMVSRSIAPPSYHYKQETPSYGFSMPTWGRSCPPESTNHTIDHPESFTNILRSDDPTDLPSGSCSPVPGTIAPIATDDIYLMNNPYDYPLTSRPGSSLHNSAPSSHYLYSSSSQQPPRLATITTSGSNTFDRKPMIKTQSNPTYPHSPPHDEGKSHHSSSALLAHSSAWSPSSDGAKTTVPPPLKESLHGRKRSAQSDAPTSPKRTVKRVRALNH